MEDHKKLTVWGLINFSSAAMADIAPSIPPPPATFVIFPFPLFEPNIVLIMRSFTSSSSSPVMGPMIHPSLASLSIEPMRSMYSAQERHILVSM
jgi:hypothetical protein